MCGIAGWVDYEQSIENYIIIKNMSDALKNRGPDSNGVYKENNVCLIHRRLIVIDPENGNQPMAISNETGEYTIVYNGELYNTS